MAGGLLEYKMEELWKEVKGYEGLYQVSTFGRVLNKYGKYMKGTIKNTGYRVVAMTKKSKTCLKYVHRLVADAFISKNRNKNTVNHKNFNKIDNHIYNLEWCTCKENIRYSWENGRCIPLIGEQKPAHKLSEEDVYKIKEILLSYRIGDITRIAKLYKVSKPTISKIYRGIGWGHIKLENNP